MNHDKRPVDINRILTDLQKKQSGAGRDGSGWTDSTAASDQSTESVSSSSTSHSSRVFDPRRVNKSCRPRSETYNNNNATAVETETDPTILTRRQKQIEYCKRTDDYKVYVSEVPRQSRVPSMPQTPDMNRKYSRRQWDGTVKRWKTQVHAAGREILKSQAQASSSSPASSASKDSSSTHQ